MNLGALFTRLTNHLRYDLDFGWAAAETSQTQVEMLAALNETAREISYALEQFHPTTSMKRQSGIAVVNCQDLTYFSRKMVRVTGVYIAGVPLRTADGNFVGLWTYDELERYRPTWRNSTAGTPTCAVQIQEDNLIFDPPFDTTDATFGASNVKISGTYMCADIENTGEDERGVINTADLLLEYDLPEMVLPALAMITAAKVAGDTVSEGVQAARIQTLYDKGNRIIEQVRKNNRKHRDMIGTTTGWMIPEKLYFG